MAVGEVKDFEINIREIGWKSQVLVDGVQVAGVYRVVIDCDVHEPTKIELHCYGPRQEPIVIKGRMVVDEETTGEARLSRYTAQGETCSKGHPIQEVTAVGDVNLKWYCPTCADA